jgi:TRAP-type mannitol/chloroaromatic compound transport system permease small subunit
MGLVEAWGETAIGWILAHIIEAFWNFGYAITHPGAWLNWADPQALMRFIYYGASVELFFVFLVFVIILTVCGMVWTNFMWAMVRAFEGVSNTVGRVAAWAGLAMVLQQIVIIFMQRVFAVSELSFGFGKVVTFPISWWSEELKLYNALVVSLCIAWTFVQGGHVRVDLVYSTLRFRTKRAIDMFGSIFFMLPAATLIWLYSWFFLWRHLVVPNPSASDTLDRFLAKSRALRWNVETIGFSPNGFNAYVLFKVLLVLFTGLLFLQAITFFYRSYLEWKEGEESEAKYLDRDVTGDPTADLVAKIH